MTTPNMLLVLPAPGTTLGPKWAEELNAALTLVDSHDHTSGKGIKVPSGGINIDADLSFNANDATDLRSVRLANQTAALADAADLRCLFAVGGDLYYNNGSGTAVQITNGNALNATATGGITGLPSGTASVSFAAGVYTFLQATNQAAQLTTGPVLIRDTAASAKGVRLKAQSGMGADIDISLPTAHPTGMPGRVEMSTAGALSTTVWPSANESSSSGTFATGSATLVDVTNLSVSVTTNGRPVWVGLIYDRSGSIGQVDAVTAMGQLDFAVTGDTTATLESFVIPIGDAFPVGSFQTVWPAAAGSYTIKARALSNGGGGTTTVARARLLAFEL